MKKTFILIAAGIAGIANAQNLVTNGDFSHDTYAAGGWTEINSSTNPSSVYGWTSIGNDLAGIGVGYLGATNQEIDLSGGYDQGGTGISQSLSTIAGKTYQLSLDVYTGGGYGYAGGVDVYVAGNELGSDLQGFTGVNASQDRKLYTYDFTATSSTTNLTLMDDHGVVSHVGNVNVQAVPEPASFLGLGLPLFGVLRKKLKKHKKQSQ